MYKHLRHVLHDHFKAAMVQGKNPYDFRLWLATSPTKCHEIAIGACKRAGENINQPGATHNPLAFSKPAMQYWADLIRQMALKPVGSKNILWDKALIDALYQEQHPVRVVSCCGCVPPPPKVCCSCCCNVRGHQEWIPQVPTAKQAEDAVGLPPSLFEFCAMD
ncbi:MAG: hypothetical protein ACYC2U_07260 [Candidatus Amoebophilus sp.]